MAEHAHAEAAPETTAAPTPLVALCGASQVQMLQRIGDAHTRGKEMAKIAIKKLCDYDGSSPSEVKTALKKHFNSESKWVANNLDHEVPQVDDTQPLWYASRAGASKTMDERASTLIHEWMHRYACKLDVGYEWEEGYADAVDDPPARQLRPIRDACFDVRLP